MKQKLITIILGLAISLSPAAFAAIKVGVAGPLTGAYAAFGEQLTRGAQKAIDDINAQGGVKGENSF